MDALATVIDDKGLAVTALSRIDPSAMYAQMMRGEDSSFSTRIKSLKYILADGTEIPAAVVLRESELDLVYIRPTTAPTDPLTFVDFSKSVEPDIMDPIFVVARNGVVARRSVLGMEGAIQSVVKLPRRFYIPSSEVVTGGAGTPIFSSLDGGLVGITAVYTSASAAAMDSDERPSIYVVVPADQVFELADDAAKAKPEEVAAEEPAAAEPTPAATEATPAAEATPAPAP